jgi:hypothetical protein
MTTHSSCESTSTNVPPIETVDALTKVTKGKGRPTKYVLKDGTQVRGVTTFIGRFKESGGLLQWAFQVGKSGATSLYQSRDEAADVGSLAHDTIEARIHKIDEPVIPPEMAVRVASALSAYQEWFDASRMQIIATEIPMVSEKYRFGGTIDAIARDGKGRLCLLDWKTSNAVYSDYAIQLSAYRQLWNENSGEQEQITDGGYHLCRFAKEHGDFEHRYWPDLSEAWKLFKLYIEAYDLDASLRKRIK